MQEQAAPIRKRLPLAFHASLLAEPEPKNTAACIARSPVLWIGGSTDPRLIVGPDGHLIATVGLNDAVVVHTPDATLVCRSHDAQDVRTVVARLSQDKRLARYA